MKSAEIESLLRRTRRWYTVSFALAIVGFLGSLVGPHSVIGNAGAVLVLLGLVGGLGVTVIGIALTVALHRSKAG